MRICVVAYKFGTEKEIGEHLGTYHYFIEKMRRLVRLGHVVYVVAPRLSFWRRGSVDVDGVKVLRYYPPFFNRPKLWIINKLLRLWYIRATQRKTILLDRNIVLDIVYVWQARETGFAVAKIADRLRAPFMFRQITAWQWHFARPMWDKKAQMKFARTIYEKAKKVVFVSRAASEEGLRAGLAPEKAEVIGVGIETDLFKPMGSKEEWLRQLEIRGRKVILFIGRINFAEKGIGYLLEAMPEIVKAVPGANLIIIGGGGESERMQKLISDLKIENHVQCVGKKPFTDLAKYLNAADVFVMPSTWLEHFGQVTVEAMACGVPVVGTAIGGTVEILGNGGILVPPKDSKALAEATIKFLLNDELRSRMGKAARQRVLENYTYEVLVDKFIKLVEHVR